MKMDKIEPVDVIVFFLAVVIGFMLVMSSVRVERPDISDARAEMVANIVTSIITIISIYVGAKVQSLVK